MNRVWKKFFIKISKGLSFFVYVISSMAIPAVIAAWLEYPPGIGIFIGSIIFLIIPGGIYLLRDIYKDCKREVEYENRDILRTLGKKQ
jgi:hypothetical protein